MTRINSTGAFADGVISTADLADSAVTETKIANSSVTNSKLGNDSVSSAKILDSAVVTAKIDDNGVTTAKIAPSAVTASELADDGVSETKILNGAVTADKLGTSAVTSAKVLDGNITTAKLADLSITTAKIANGNITLDKMASSSVDASKLATDAVTTVKILDGNVTNVKLATDSVSTAKIADNSVTTAKILDANVTSSKIADDAVDSQHYNASSIDGEHLSSDAKQTVFDYGARAIRKLLTSISTGTGDTVDITSKVFASHFDNAHRRLDGEIDATLTYGLLTDLSSVSPHNKALVRDQQTEDVIVDGSSRKVYARITATEVNQTGTATFTNGSPNVVGVGTAFLSEIAVGDYIKAGSKNLYYKVNTVTDDTNIVLDANFTEATSAADNVTLATVTANFKVMIAGTETAHNMSSQVVDMVILFSGPSNSQADNEAQCLHFFSG